MTFTMERRIPACHRIISCPVLNHFTCGCKSGLTDAVPQGVLEEARLTLVTGLTLEGALCVLAHKLLTTVVGSNLTFINICQWEESDKSSDSS